MFDEYLKREWQRHADQSQAVFDGLRDGIAAVKQPGQRARMAALIVHISGEHMGRWSDGQGLLTHLLDTDIDDPDGDKSIHRCKAILYHCSGEFDARDAALAQGRSDFSEASDRVRMLATAASALLGQQRIEDAAEAFQGAVDIAAYGPDATDPAARALAIAGNNLAATLESGVLEDERRRSLLATAAKTARKYWAIAGNWVNIERAEYRLAMTHLALKDAETAREHAQNCLEGCLENDADALERFFAHEALAKAYFAVGNAEEARRSRDLAAAQVPLAPENLRQWLAGELAKLDAGNQDNG